ncbi:MAG TPA: NAD-dependent epimerase/dehydratase family protein [Sumerlaeia bacterium]|nr:NAD-dependent epimerase/dehydratase family protein [Sumerlaeia bacterium]
MPERMLVTGGAGFIGSHLVDALIERGHQVRILDNLDPQVHGPERRAPEYLNPRAEFVQGDVLDEGVLWDCVKDVDVIFHQAARVGVGQSMYEILSYTRVNVMGTALLLDLLVNRREQHSVRKLLVASSMSIYGEGAYETQGGKPVSPPLRSLEQMQRGVWDVLDPETGEPLRAVATPETKPLQPTSVYAVGKRDQEEMVLSVGRAYNIPAVALRYFNVYGPRQALSNPYTGVAAMFASRVLNGRPPVIFEDGRQVRDLVHVSDIVQANLLAMENEAADYEVFNVGAGRPVSVLEEANAIIARLAPDSGIVPRIENRFRAGDVRDCFADVSKIRERLGYEPTVDFRTNGIEGLCAWAREQSAEDRFDQARAELRRRGLA